MPTKTKMFTVNKVLIFRATAMGAAGAVAGGASRRGGPAASRPPGEGARPGRGAARSGARSGAVLQHRRAAPRPAPAFAPRGPRRGGLGGMERGAAQGARGAEPSRCWLRSRRRRLSSSSGGSRSPALALRRPKRRAPVRSDVLRGISSTCTRWSRRAVPCRAAPPRPRLPAPHPGPAGCHHPPAGPAVQPRQQQHDGGMNEPGQLRAPLPWKMPVAIFSSLPT